MIEETTFSVFRDIGRDIFLRGLISSHAGNMSIRLGEKILITRRASMIGQLKAGDIIEVEIEKDDGRIPMASSEFVVHRAIYENTNALSVVHAHPSYATLLSMSEEELVPIDAEGSYLLKKVPVVSPEKTIGSEEASRVVSECLKNYKVVLIRGHGSFARGDTLEEAYMLTSSLESSAFLLYHHKGRRKD
jgi:L-fuculose-phosphate aldolase